MKPHNTTTGKSATSTSAHSTSTYH